MIAVVVAYLTLVGVIVAVAGFGLLLALLLIPE